VGFVFHLLFVDLDVSFCLGDEIFDLSVEKPLWLMVSIRDWALVGKQDIVGRAYLCLDQHQFSDFLAHELWMDLDIQGRILMRVSMEGEKDDIQFFFGRGFRLLKRAEADMLKSISKAVEKDVSIVQTTRLFYHWNMLICTTP
jgi:hypothetical protein